MNKGETMYFPDTVDEFMEEYKMVDTKEIYSNGIEYVPIFRMKQWFEHSTVTKPDICREGWISVEDKMPKDCGEDWVLVLVYDGDFECIPSVAEYRKGHWWGHTFCTEDDCIDGECSPFVVKYWKPINATVPKSDICKDMVSKKVVEYFRWERDLAIKQLNDLGIGFGEKKSKADICREFWAKVLIQGRKTRHNVHICVDNVLAEMEQGE